MTPPKRSARELAALINGLPMSKEGLLLDAGQVVEIIETLERAAEVEADLAHEEELYGRLSDEALQQDADIQFLGNHATLMAKALGKSRHRIATLTAQLAAAKEEALAWKQFCAEAFKDHHDAAVIARQLEEKRRAEGAE